MAKPKNVLQDLAEDIQFEMGFYSYIAGSTDYEVLPIGGAEGLLLSEEDFEHIHLKAEQEGIVILYRVCLGETAIIVNPKTDKIGIVPEYSNDGFPC